MKAEPDPCFRPGLDPTFFCAIWKPTDLAYLHVMKQSEFEPQIWAKLPPLDLVCQLVPRATRKTCLIKLFSRN